MTITHPAGPGTVANILTQRIRERLDDSWGEEVDETTWRAEDHADDCWGERWVIVAIGQIAPRERSGGRPGPLIVASGGNIEMRFQLPYVVGQDQIDALIEALVSFGAIPAAEEGR